MASDFVALRPWWRTRLLSRVVLSDNGVEDILQQLEGKNAFIIIDQALAAQERFEPLFAMNNKYLFNASQSEPKTSDVDMLVAPRRNHPPELVLGVGGGGTMDLAKAVGICLNNPQPAAVYQGWGFELNPGVAVWTLPTLSGTGAELTPIAVLRGPEKKLGINSPLVAPQVTVIDPELTEHAPAFNRFYTMMDCYYHHYEITLSKTSEPDAVADAKDGLQLCRQVLSGDLRAYNREIAELSAKASVLSGSSTVGGRVGASHAISYGLSNAAPTLPHSVAVTMSMLGLGEVYGSGVDESLSFLKAHNITQPKARDYGIGMDKLDNMVSTALGMDKLWLSHFGDNWQSTVDREFLSAIYSGIINQ